MNKKVNPPRLYHLFKRVIDIVLSLVLLVLLFPFQIIIYLIIKVQENGPAIFKQERIGKNGEYFYILKFRTMKLNTPNIAAAEIHEEEYVTKIGKFLRRTSLDELPQIVNILKGEMSFVGPRPLIPNEGKINQKRLDLGVQELRPGLTGWAQVIARNTCDQDEKLQLDLFYKEHENLWLDLKIIFLTFFAMVHEKDSS